MIQHRHAGALIEQHAEHYIDLSRKVPSVFDTRVAESTCAIHFVLVKAMTVRLEEVCITHMLGFS